jgi:DNA polymerase-3 subunit epsilon
VVAGHRIDEASVTAFVDDAVIVIAHNSDFDRKFAARYWPIFEQKAWGCSATEIDWRRHGFAGAQLGYLLNGAGFFHLAAVALANKIARMFVLARGILTRILQCPNFRSAKSRGPQRVPDGICLTA